MYNVPIIPIRDNNFTKHGNLRCPPWKNIFLKKRINICKHGGCIHDYTLTYINFFIKKLTLGVWRKVVNPWPCNL